MPAQVSIIIAAHNAKRWLGEAVDSALAQTYRPCEVLVVDDGSTDDTHAWLGARYADRIQYVWKPHGGLSSARNAGLRAARGAFIQFLDADDLLQPEKVRTHVAFLEAHPEVDVVYGHCLCFLDGLPDTFEWPRRARYRSGRIFATMLDGGYFHTHMLLSRREALEAAGGFDETLTSCVEWDFWLRVARGGATFQYLDGPPMALYRVRPDSSSQQFVNHARSGLRVLRKMSAYVDDEAGRRALRRAEGRWTFALGKALAESGDPASGWRQMARSLLQDRRDLNYKLAYMALCLVRGPRRADQVLAALKSAKDRVFNAADHGGGGL